MTKEELKQKNLLKELASDIGFESVMFADEFVNSNREELRFILWSTELTRYLLEKTKSPIYQMVDIGNITKTTDYLINKITMHQDAGVLPKKVKK